MEFDESFPLDAPGICRPPRPLAITTTAPEPSDDLTVQLAADARSLLAALRADQQARRQQCKQVSLGLGALLAEAEEAKRTQGTYGASSCRSCSLMLQEVTDLQARYATAEAELHAESLEARTDGSVEEFARACAEVLLGAGAAEEQAAMEARQALEVVQHYQAKVPNLESREALASRRSEIVEAQQAQLLAVSEESAAQAFRAACAEEELTRMREWSLAHEATAKAEALTAQRCRSEMATAMQELQRFHRMRQLQQSLSLPQAQPPQLRLESIPECGNSTGSWGEEECEIDDQDAEGGRELENMPGEQSASLASTEADENDQEEMKALILKLQGELLDAEVDRARAMAQRDEAQEAVAALREENEALVLAMQLLDSHSACPDPEAAGHCRHQPACLPGSCTGSAKQLRQGQSYMGLVATDPAGRLRQADALLNQAMEDLARLRSVDG